MFVCLCVCVGERERVRASLPGSCHTFSVIVKWLEGGAQLHVYRVSLALLLYPYGQLFLERRNIPGQKMPPENKSASNLETHLFTFTFSHLADAFIQSDIERRLSL